MADFREVLHQWDKIIWTLFSVGNESVVFAEQFLVHYKLRMITHKCELKLALQI